MSALSIRRATRADASLIAALVAELAEQQGDPTGRISAAALEGDAFGPAPEFEVLIAEQAGGAIGYALFHPCYEPSHSARGVHVADLYVRPQARRRGVGRALAAAVAGHAQELGRSYLWWVAKLWNEPALASYRALSAVPAPVVAHAITFEDFDRLAREGGRGG